ncbi:hypothetical protein B0I35DRAFT_444083 [Stachybotrys elegans]|uniref:Extracellular membrane protein CFEM domain-containing protein n=1 Tax=Stachybotrys elegans TaxID=80388 RepID=A0A8K0SEV9_9HYPO|nr:hypothetical protein B0I35DRAFT_444083 [Stachybotrys elegans]
MTYGCGDGSRLTSYRCFCTQSYSKMGWDISTSVARECTHDRAQVTSALQVFHDYCENGTSQLDSITIAPTATPTSDPILSSLMAEWNVTGQFLTESGAESRKSLKALLYLQLVFIMLLSRWWM